MAHWYLIEGIPSSLSTRRLGPGAAVSYHVFASYDAVRSHVLQHRPRSRWLITCTETADAAILRARQLAALGAPAVAVARAPRADQP